MLFRSRFLLPLAAGFLGLLPSARGLDIQFDYSLDSANFFNGHPDRMSLLDSAAAVFESHLADVLSAISPGGGNTWSATFSNPSTGNTASVDNLSIGTGVVKVYVGARQLGSGTLGMGGYGGWGASGNQAWFDTIEARGQSGTLATPATDFATWGGAITFDIDSPWYFGTGSLSGKDDFLSVAIHELGHLLGMGTAPSWDALISGSKFTGAHATAANGGTQVSLSGDLGHWAEGTLSTVFGTTTTQEAAMDPSLLVGTQKFFTTLDFAGMQDIGWSVVPEPSAAALMTGALLVLAFSTGRKRGVKGVRV
jgi:hypothetical protein